MKTLTAFMLVCLSVPCHAECLTKEERKAANERYHRCMAQADSNLQTYLLAWDAAGCDTIPQPRNCAPPYPRWEKDKGQCLEEFKAGVTE